MPNRRVKKKLPPRKKVLRKKTCPGVRFYDPGKGAWKRLTKKQKPPRRRK